jgi:FtsP/CotA-like multicopper oxidase with cupredoxin domain
VRFATPWRAATAVVLVLVLSGSVGSRSFPVVQANDNTVPAGALANDTLKISLIVQVARWYPESPDGPFVDVAAFAEEGRAPQIPAPLIRVREGTVILATVRNDLPDSTVWVGGLSTRPAANTDSIPLLPGETRIFQFLAGDPGTYSYHASPGKIDTNVREREQGAGALIVDAVGARTDDRILVINGWGEPVDSLAYRNALTINGRSWPATERFAAEVGDTLRWRVINASSRGHPMHLHGFYFNVMSRGSVFADSSAGGRLAVTEHMREGGTMSIQWTPDRPGNWLFHCHLIYHVVEAARLDGREGPHSHVHDPMKHMAGLVSGITVTDPKGLARYSSAPARRFRLFATERQHAGPTGMRMSYVLQRDSKEPAPDSVEHTGGAIILTKGEPAEVTIVNRSHAATSVHWHGLELESYSDGVAGWSGMGMQVAPMIAPNDSFTARLTVPRAGTFMYHTHLNDVEQLLSGAYGPIIVIEPGETFDPRTDHIFTLGRDAARQVPRLVINGDTIGIPLLAKVGETHRFRLINITDAYSPTFTLGNGTSLVTWNPRAKDGADYPEAMRKETTAVQRLNPGEIFDAEWTPRERGEFLLRVGSRTRVFYTRKIIVE